MGSPNYMGGTIPLYRTMMGEALGRPMICGIGATKQCLDAMLHLLYGMKHTYYYGFRNIKLTECKKGYHMNYHVIIGLCIIRAYNYWMFHLP